ncbi:Sphingosine-1-phosphate phosphohydrolase [Entamoeba marina]
MLLLLTRTRELLFKTVTKSMPGVQKLQKRRIKSLDLFFFIMTHLAGVGVYVLLVPTAWWIHPSPSSIEVSNALVQLIAVTTYIGNFMKNLFACPRPSGVWQPVKEVDFGFPSTHTMNAVANGLFFISYYQPNHWIKILIILYIIIIALSRVYIGVHSPADVIAGVLLGVVSFLFFNYFPDLPRVWYFIPLMIIIQFCLLSFHSLCFSRYTPCYWRSVIGFGFILWVFIMETYGTHRSIETVPDYYCLIQSPHLMIFGLILGFICSSIIIPFKLLLDFICKKYSKIMQYLANIMLKIRFHCHLDPLEFTQQMNVMKIVYAIEFISYYVTGMVLGYICTTASPYIIQKQLPELFSSALCQEA